MRLSFGQSAPMPATPETYAWFHTAMNISMDAPADQVFEHLNKLLESWNVPFRLVVKEVEGYDHLAPTGHQYYPVAQAEILGLQGERVKLSEDWSCTSRPFLGSIDPVIYRKGKPEMHMREIVDTAMRKWLASGNKFFLPPEKGTMKYEYNAIGRPVADKYSEPWRCFDFWGEGEQRRLAQRIGPVHILKAA